MKTRFYILFVLMMLTSVSGYSQNVRDRVVDSVRTRINSLRERWYNGLDMSHRRRIDAAINISNRVDDMHNYVQNFKTLVKEKRQIPLPVGIESHGSGYKLLVSEINRDNDSVTSIKLDCVIPLRESIMVFEGKFTITGNSGICSPGTIRLMAPLEIGRHVKIKFKESTYADFDCDGLNMIHADVDVVIDDTKLVCFDDEYKKVDGPVTFSTKIDFSDVNNFIFSLDKQVKFAFKDLEDWIFSIGRLDFDNSEERTADTLVFPDTYFSSADDRNLWKGVAAGKASLRLPVAEDSTKAKTIDCDYLIIDDNGFSVSAKARNYGWRLDTSKAFAMDVDNAEFLMLKNDIQKIQFDGDFNWKALGRFSAHHYNALYNDADKVFEIASNLGDSLDLDLFCAELSLDKSSRLDLKMEHGKFKPSITANGKVTINAGPAGSALHVPQLDFEGMVLQTEKPYFQPGTWGMEGNISSSFGGMELQINGFHLRNDSLNFGVTMDFGQRVIAEGGFNLLGDYDLMRLRRFSVSRFGIRTTSDVFDIHGSVEFQRNDPIYGNYFRGDVKLKIVDLFEVDAVGLFGKVNGSKYFFADLYAEGAGSRPLFTIAPKIDVFGIGGGAYRHMDQTAEQLETGRALSGIYYKPNMNVGFGFTASMKFAIVKKDICDAKATLDVQFNNNWGLNYVKLKGDAVFMNGNDKFGKIKEDINKRLGDATERLNATMANITNTTNSVMGVAANAIDNVRNNANSYVANARTNANTAVDNAQNRANTAIDNAQDRANNAVNNARDNMNAAVDGAQTQFNNGVSAVRNTMNTTIDNAQTSFDNGVAAVQGVVNGAVDNTVTAFNNTVDGAQDIFNNTIDDTQTGITDYVQNAVSAYSGVATNAANSAASRAVDYANGKVDDGQTYINDHVDQGQNYVTSHVEQAQGYVNDHIQQGQNYVNEHIEQGQGYVNDKIQQGQQYVNEHVDQAQTYVNDHIQQGQDYVNEHINQGQDYANEHIDQAQDYVNNQVDNAMDRANEAVNNVLGAMGPYEVSQLPKPELSGQYPLTASLLMDYNNQNKTFFTNMSAYLDMGIIHGAGQNNKLVDATAFLGNSEWYFRMGTPTDRCGIVTDLKFLKADLTSYFMAGNGIPGLPDPPDKVMRLLSEDSKSIFRARKGLQELSNGKGMAFGAAFNAGVSVNPWPFYASLNVGAGGEFLLTNYGKAAHCKNREGAIGIDGWYASAQLWAYLDAAIGIKVKFLKKERTFNIMDAAAGVVLTGQGPNPFYFAGAVGCQYRVLGGLFKGKCSIKFEIGDPCEVQKGGVMLDQSIIASLVPDNGADTVSVFVSPQMLLNVAANIPMDMDMDGQKTLYKVRVDYLKLTKADGGESVKGSYSVDRDGLIVTFDPEMALESETRYNLEGKVSFMENQNGNWVVAKDGNGEEFTELMQSSFKSGKRPDHILPEHIVCTYPVDRMYNYYPDETKEGYICISKNYSYLFTEVEEGYEQKLSVSTLNGQAQLTGFTHLPSTEVKDEVYEIRFDLGSIKFDKQEIYKLQVMNLPKTTSHNNENVSTGYTVGENGDSTRAINAEGTLNVLESKQICRIDFRTSKYKTLKEKVEDIKMSGEAVVHGPNVFMKNMNINLTTDDYWDGFESQTENNNGCLVMMNADLDNTEWYNHSVFKKMYSSYSKSDIGYERVFSTPPSDALTIFNSESLNHGKLTDQEIASSIPTGLFSYGNLGYYVVFYCHNDIQNLKNKLANKRDKNGILSSSDKEIIEYEHAVPYTRGNYPYILSYRLPGKGKITSSVDAKLVVK